MYGYITDVDICNLALNYLGKGSIESLDERSELARTCKLHYDRYRRMALTATTWGFALKTQPLKKLDVEIPGYKAIFEYPDTALELVRVYEKEDAERKMDYRNSFYLQQGPDGGRALCTNEEFEEPYVDLIEDVEDTTLFTDGFIEALSHYLAYGMAQALTGSESKAQTEMQYYNMSLQQEAFRNERERKREPHWPTRYFDGRF